MLLFTIVTMTTNVIFGCVVVLQVDISLPENVADV